MFQDCQPPLVRLCTYLSMRPMLPHSCVFSVIFLISSHLKLKRVKRPLFTILLETPKYREKIEFRLPFFFRSNTTPNVSNRNFTIFMNEKRPKTVYFFHFSPQNCCLFHAGWVWNIIWHETSVLHWFHWQMRKCFFCSGATAWPH